jgi:hypothetical protein
MKINRKIQIFCLGGWKAQGLQTGGFGLVLARKVLWAGRFGIRGSGKKIYLHTADFSLKEVCIKKIIPTY